LIFFIYINDIIDASKILHLILFADDTNIFLSNADLDKLIFTLNNELACMSKWFVVGLLTIKDFFDY